MSYAQLTDVAKHLTLKEARDLVLNHLGLAEPDLHVSVEETREYIDENVLVHNILHIWYLKTAPEHTTPANFLKHIWRMKLAKEKLRAIEKILQTGKYILPLLGPT